MKRIALLALCALLSAALPTVALAQAYAGGAFEMQLPQGYRVIDEEDMEGYRQAAARDIGAQVEVEALLAVADGASLSVLCSTTDRADALEVAEALVAEYAGYIEGFEAVEPESVQAGENTFAQVQFSLDGEIASQYFLVESGALFTLTFVGATQEDMLEVLKSFAPAGRTGTASPSASASPAAP